MQVGDVYLGPYSRSPYVVLWMGQTTDPSGRERCLLAPLDKNGVVKEDDSWDSVQRIEDRWILSPEHSTRFARSPE